MKPLYFGVALVLFGCGAAEMPASDGVATISGAEAAAVENEAAPSEQSMQVEGLMGTLSPDEVRRGMDGRMQRFTRCFTRRYRDLELLSGDVEFAFRIALDGTVRSVHLTRSTLGDRETERCLLGVAEGARFRPPRGGEAEFSFPLSMELPEDIRPPVQWSASRVERTLADEGAELLSACRPAGSGGTYRVTMYVERPGRVLAAGVTSDDASLDGTYDCVVEQVSSWEVPTPGSYPARVSFEVR